MGEIEGRLDPRRFFRINRKFMIGFTAIKDMVRYSNSRVKVVLQPAPPQSIEAIVSNERVREFKEWLNRWQGRVSAFLHKKLSKAGLL